LAVFHGNVSATLDIQALPSSVKDPSEALKCLYQGKMNVFSDFYFEDDRVCEPSSLHECHLEHQEDSRITVVAFPRKLNMVLRAPDVEPFPVVSDFATLSEPEQREQVEVYSSYFQHEFGLMVHSFLETTPGLFNWQIWQWFPHKELFISKAEVRALLRSGQRPSRIELFRATCQDGRKLRFWSNGQGTMGMDLN